MNFQPYHRAAPAGTVSLLISASGRALRALVLVLTASALSGIPAWCADRPEYNRDVRPILAENCFACHGPDSAARKAKLRLDVREEALKAEVFVPGHPEKSRVVERIFSDDPNEQMPPPRARKKLTTSQKETLRRWIASGAEYQPHWSFIAPRRPELNDNGWARNPIDRFILAELQKQQLAPAPEADRRTLARRLSLDLTGLPPQPEEVERFVNDTTPNAYENLVDRLLDSPHWGEHRARYWLDAARYADTHGIHFDNYREMWTYRDWVINAFNRNLPFDRFTIEQLAGDLLPNPTLEQLIATGFNRCNITTNEGGVIPEEYLVLYTRDRTETVARIWLGLTANCAVCHDHKFDPVTQREFYEMAAFFNNTTQGAMDGNIKDTPPVIVVPKAEDRPRWEKLSAELADVRQQAEARKKASRPSFDEWLGHVRPGPLLASMPHEGLRFHALLNEGAGTLTALVDGQLRTLVPSKPPTWKPGHVAAQAFQGRADTAVEVDEAGDFEKHEAFSCGAWVRLDKNRMTGAVVARMDDRAGFRGWDLWVDNGRFGTHIINKWPDDAIRVVTQDAVKAGDWNHVFVTYDGSGKAEGVKIYLNGVLQERRLVTQNSLSNSIRAPVPLRVAQRYSSSSLDGVLLQDLRVYGRELVAEEVSRLTKGARAAWLVSKPADKRSDAEKNELFDWWLPSADKVFQNLAARIAELGREESAIKSRGTIAHVMQERTSEPIAYVLYRGEYDQRRDPVKAGTPHTLPPMPSDLPRNRLGFAQWLLRPDNPLPARVTVNRFWQEVFGTGIVRSSSDFGATGELPSHPELLDWLAVEFRETGWDVKRLFKSMVMSATYRQSAIVTPEKYQQDPENRLLARGRRFRMDAEMIRDNALAASGLLVHKIGGPSVRPYQPDGVWEAVAMIGSNTREYRRDAGDQLYRRSLYTFWKRAAPPASMDVFNAPTRETCTVCRERTNTPLQALVTLNDTQFVEGARHLAQLALKQGGSQPEGRIDFIARRLLARPLRPEEAKLALANVIDLLAFYRAHPDDAKKLVGVGESKADLALEVTMLAAWTMLTNELMNLDEVLNQ